MQRGNKINTAKHTVRNFPAGVSYSASYAANPQFAVIFYFFGKKIPVPLQIYPFSPLQYRLKSYIIGGRNRSVRFSDGFGRFFFFNVTFGRIAMENFDNLKKTPLFEKHCALGGKIVDFGGWALPVQYTSILDECKAVRERAGLFDVSHMGEVDIIGNDAYAYMQKMVTNDVTSMTPGRCRYAVMCYDNGGAVDDVLIYKFADDHYMLIVNAGNTDKDFAWLSEHAFGDVQVINNSAKWGQLALQGPLHQAVLDAAGFEGEIPQKYYTFNDKMTVAGIPCLVSRTGYTGEDGVELYCAAEDTVRLFEALLEAGKGVDMLPCGLGARDTLRFEASMPLYGHEMSADINPVECGLGFAIKFNKPDFIGKEALLKPQTRKRIGLKIVGKGIARPDADVLCNGEKVGIVTSGGPAPAVGGNYAMALVSADADENGTWAVSVRGRVIDCEFAPMPFYKRK